MKNTNKQVHIPTEQILDILRTDKGCKNHRITFEEGRKNLYNIKIGRISENINKYNWFYHTSKSNNETLELTFLCMHTATKDEYHYPYQPYGCIINEATFYLEWDNSVGYVLHFLLSSIDDMMIRFRTVLGAITFEEYMHIAKDIFFTHMCSNGYEIVNVDLYAIADYFKILDSNAQVFID